MKRSVRNAMLVLVVVLAAGIAAGFLYTHRDEEMVGASVIVLNYSDVDFYPSVLSLDEKGQATASAGYPVGPRAGGGGAVCCVLIPEHWRPGIRMAVRYRLGDWPEDRHEMYYTDLAPYPSGEAANVWVAVYPDRSIEVVSSKYDPDSRKGLWPGRIKQLPR